MAMPIRHPQVRNHQIIIGFASQQQRLASIGGGVTAKAFRLQCPHGELAHQEFIVDHDRSMNWLTYRGTHGTASTSLCDDSKRVSAATVGATANVAGERSGTICEIRSISSCAAKNTGSKSGSNWVPCPSAIISSTCSTGSAG